MGVKRQVDLATFVTIQNHLLPKRLGEKVILNYYLNIKTLFDRLNNIPIIDPDHGQIFHKYGILTIRTCRLIGIP